MAILQRYEGQDGIEILINTETGESFCSVKGYARMAGKDQSTISKRLASANADQGVASEACKTAEILTAGGVQRVVLVSEDLIAEWLPKDNPTATTALLKLGVRVVLHSMAGYEVKSTIAPQMTADQFQSFKHEFETFNPWAAEFPIAASIFLERQGIKPTILQPTLVQSVETQPLPSAEAMAALDGAFLNLNRSGLMMNKLFKFLDRIPTMKALDEEFVNELVDGLSQSEIMVKKAQAGLKAKSLEYDKLGRETKYLETQNDLLELQISALKDEINDLKLQLPIPVKAAEKKTKMGTKTYRRPKADQLPSTPMRYALPPSN